MYPNNFYNNNLQQISDAIRHPKKRVDEMKTIVDRLRQATSRGASEIELPTRSNQHQNRNEVYALANSILIKEIHLNGVKYSKYIELLKGLGANIGNGEFLMVLRTDGRIVVMTEEAEHHLGKTMRSIYTQCINIFECLVESDAEKFRSILNSSSNNSDEEHRLVFDFRLPKGKRPSRVNEDVKTIAMTGHFFSCHDYPSSSYEKLFIARCEALVSQTTNKPGSSQVDNTSVNSISSNIMKFTLKDDMSIESVSSNAEDILGYRRHELNNLWFGRLLTTDDLQSFEEKRKKTFKHDQLHDKQSPMSVCDIFDLYTKNGDDRLTFLYQLRSVRERRTKPVKYSLVIQLIDPTLKKEYERHIQSKSSNPTVHLNVQQVNLEPISIPKSNKDSLMANSPTLAEGLLNFDYFHNIDDIKRSSTHDESFWNVETPLEFSNKSFPIFFDYPIIEQKFKVPKWENQSTNFFDQCLSEGEMNQIFNDPADPLLLDWLF